MANEAVKVELYDYSTGKQRRFTVADGTAITKGAILKMTDPRTAALSDGVADVPAGIAAAAKEASDGATSISVWTDGIFDLKASGAITVGQKVVSSIDNYVRAATDAQCQSSYALIIGTALETATAGEVINVRVNL